MITGSPTAQEWGEGMGFLANRVGPGGERVRSVWPDCTLTVIEVSVSFFLTLTGVSLIRE